MTGPEVTTEGLAPAPLVGREHEFDFLRAALSASSSVVCVEGESGIGKTRLLEHVHGEAADLGFVVFDATTRELELRRAFGSITDALRVSTEGSELRSRIAKLLTVERAPSATPPAEASALEYRIHEELLALIADECAASRVVLSLDDLQWADVSTIGFLARLGRDMPEGLILLLAFRPIPRPKELERLVAELTASGATHVDLPPLDTQSVAKLVEHATGAIPGARLLSHTARGGGNPLFVLEILGALERDGELERTGSTIEARSSQGAASIHLTILHELSYLPGEVLELLKVAAVLGTSFRVVDLAALLRRNASELLSTLEVAISAGLLIEHGSEIAFRHDLIRQALYDDLPTSLREAMHRDAATRLLDTGAPAVLASEHLLRGGALRSPEEASILRRAADEVAASAPAIAVSLLEAILDSSLLNDDERSVAARLAEAYYASGRVGDAIELIRSSDLHGEARLRQVLISALLTAGRKHEAIDELEAADAGWESPAQRAFANSMWSVALMELGNVVDATAKAERAADDAREAQDDVPLSLALAQLGAMRSFAGGLSEGLELAREAVMRADRTQDHAGHRFHIEMFHAQLATFVDLLDEAEQATHRGRMLAEHLGTRWNLVFYSWTALNLDFLRGRWDDAIAEYEAGIALAEDLGTRDGLQYAHAIRGMIALHRDDPETADAYVRRAEEQFAADGPQYGTLDMLMARAMIHEATGDIAQAHAILTGAWAVCSTAFRSELARVGPHVVRVAVAQGDRAAAQAVVDTMEQLARELPDVNIVHAAAQRCAGMLSHDLDVMAGSVERYRRSPRLHERAVVLAEAASIAASEGRKERARTFSDEARSVFVDLDALRDLAGMDERLRRYGLKRAGARSRSRPRFGWESLTETEMRVAALVAEGLSNPRIAERMFVSRYTVQTHVAHILAKLSVASRSELAAAYVRMSSAPDR